MMRLQSTKQFLLIATTSRTAAGKQVAETPPRVASTTDPPAEVARVAAELKEDQESRPDYLGKPRRVEKRIAELVRQREEYRARSEALAAELQNRPQAQVTPQQTQSVLEELNAVRARLPEVEAAFTEKHPDYQETVARLLPGRESPISALQYHHILLNTPNPEAVAYHLAKNPEMLARMQKGDTTIPAGRVVQERAVIVADRLAAANLRLADSQRP